jgi:prepilin-type N-terminal cleavage/methylation domain-containing protein
MKRASAQAAFTLIELLVVIGIIAVLIAILIPVVGKVRLAAQTANTTNQMHKISAAIQNYHNDFLAYPGALANSEFTPSGNLSQKLGNTSTFFPNFAKYTQSEDMPMALLGGFQFDANGKLDLRPNEVGLGPVSFNTVTVQPRKNAYIERRPEDFTPLLAGKLAQLKQIAELGMNYVDDSEAPEFVDLYSSPRPILYMRANSGGAAGNILYNSKKSGQFKSTFSYDWSTITPYLKTSTPNPDFAGKDETDSNVQAYFTSSSGNTAKGAGAYILIDAGPDRIFGTADDIVVTAGGGQ